MHVARQYRWQKRDGRGQLARRRGPRAKRACKAQVSGDVDA